MVVEGMAEAGTVEVAAAMVTGVVGMAGVVPAAADEVAGVSLAEVRAVTEALVAEAALVVSVEGRVATVARAEDRGTVGRKQCPPTARCSATRSSRLATLLRPREWRGARP